MNFACDCTVHVLYIGNKICLNLDLNIGISIHVNCLITHIDKALEFKVNVSL